MLKPPMKRAAGLPKPSLETSFREMRCFSFGLKLETCADDAASGQSSSTGALTQITDFEQLIPQIRQVLDHLEYFLHTDVQLLSSLLRVLAGYLAHRKKDG